MLEGNAWHSRAVTITENRKALSSPGCGENGSWILPAQPSHSLLHLEAPRRDSEQHSVADTSLAPPNTG